MTPHDDLAPLAEETPALAPPEPVAFERVPESARSLLSVMSFLRAGIFSLIGLSFLAVLWSSADVSEFLPAWLCILAGLLWVGLLLTWATLWPGAVWRRKYWRLTDVALELNSGVLFRRQMTVPRSRVQHTEVTQGPLQRRFGLATLTAFTAGERFAAVSVSGLDETRARNVRDELLNRAPDHVV